MNDNLKIVHVFRDPVGGVFRHVRDLVGEQSKQGHQVGIICDSTTGGEYEDNLFEQIRPDLVLGLHRIAMTRSISPRDLLATLKTSSLLGQMQPDVVHCHSAKGGVYGRLGAKLASSGKNPIKAFYCPHGGAMHYDKASIKGKVFFFAERLLERFTDSLIFVSGYEQNAYHEKIGSPSCPETIVYNGLSEEEFIPVEHNNDAASFLYIGMKRDLKGPDVFLDALAIARESSGIDLTAHFVGDGPDVEKYHKQILSLKLNQCVTEHKAMPAREAFKLAQIIVVPSRAESMPYLVLEAIAAHRPIICTDVGGIPEVFAERQDELVPAGDANALATAMLKSIDTKNLGEEAESAAIALKEKFSLAVMSEHIVRTYRY